MAAPIKPLRMSVTQATRNKVAAAERKAARLVTSDSYQNFAARVGIGTDNLSTGSTYGFNPVTRIRQLLEWAYRGSWLVGMAVDIIADDMTRAGVELSGELSPDDRDKLIRAQVKYNLWDRVNSTIKWSRLYGGALLVFLVDQQDPSTPLRLETIAPGQFKGFLVLDRWMVDPSFNDLVTDMNEELGMPKYYRVTADAPALRNQNIHYSRVVRFIGDELPWWQFISENMWGMSVLERLWDRLTCFDSTTQGAAQLVYKAHLRTHKVKDLRSLIAAGGKMMEALVKQMQFVRATQSNEGLTLIDGEDEFETHTYSFAGLSDVMNKLGEQLSGALQIPLTRLFGQSPSGLNNTGENDLRTYYDGINQRQEKKRTGIDTAFKLIAAGEGIQLPDDFGFTFRSLWQLSEEEKANVAKTITETVLAVAEAGYVSERRVLEELRRQAPMTGVWNTIEDEDIERASDEPMPADEMLAGLLGEEGGGVDPKTGKPMPGKPPVPGQKPGEKPDLAVLKSKLAGGNKKDDDGKAGAEEGGAGASTEAQARRTKSERTDDPDQDPLKSRKADTTDAASKLMERRLLGPRLPLMEVHGLQLLIETYKGEQRSGGVYPNRWTVTMPAHYGFIRGTSSAEGALEAMDVFVMDDPGSDIWIIDTLRPEAQTFDEHKCVFGCEDEEAVRALFRAAYHDNAEARIGAITRVKLAEFKRWLRQGNVMTPYAWRELKA